MKPIFKEEKEFLEEQLHIQLPDFCWRKGTQIFLNPNTSPELIRFKVQDHKMKLIKNNIIEVLANNKNHTWDEEIEINKERLIALENESIEKTIPFIQTHKEYEIRVSHSGGKDSDVMYVILMKIFKKLNITDYTIDFYNTSNDTAQTYLHIKNDFSKDKLQVHSPKMGWYQWLKEVKNYFIPSVTVRNCCSTYKEGQVKKVLDKNKKYLIFLGMRKYESVKRSNYDWDLNKAIKKMGIHSNMPDNWLRFLPIVNWTDLDIWLYILWKGIKINEMYYKGFHRCGCLICPFQQDYIDLLIAKYYPTQWKRWATILEKNYEIYRIGQRLKWTLDEWKNGKWKQGTSKEQELITKKPTQERVKELAKIKNISENMALKYFNKMCKCGKKLNPTELAMFYKTYGRYEELEDDNRQCLCKKCLCIDSQMTKEEYEVKAKEYSENGCNLF